MVMREIERVWQAGRQVFEARKVRRQLLSGGVAVACCTVEPLMGVVVGRA